MKNCAKLILLAALVVIFWNPVHSQSYCAAGANSTDGEKITNIAFNTINNPSSSGAGYEDFTNITTTVQHNNSYLLTITFSPQFSFSQGIVWIDYNQDGDFTDPGEEVYTSGIGYGPYNAFFTIPASASLGNTRMRIRLHNTFDGANSTPCGNSIYGQVEDYTVNIIPPSCTGTPTPGNTLSSANPVAPGVNFTLSLQNTTPGSGVTYQWKSSLDGTTYTDISGATNSTLTPIQAISQYFKCTVTCSGNSATSNPLLVITYCAAGANNGSGGKISNVTFATINNSSSSTTGYENFTNVTGTVEANNTYLFSGTQVNGSSVDEMIAWIDYNKDGDFDDVGELVFYFYGSGPYSGLIAIPSSTLGNTRMRVRLNTTLSGSNPYPCGNSSYGQVEDYSLNIIPQQPCTGTPAPGNTLSTANPACNGASFTLSLQNAINGTGVTYQWQSSPNGTTYTNISGATNPTLTTSQTAYTYYRCVVNCSGNSATSSPLFATRCYCAAESTTANGSKISNVTFATINNPSSSTARYESFVNIIGTVQHAEPYIFTGTIANGSGGDEIIAWIDYNQDGDLTDAGEEIFHSPTGPGPHSGIITIPLGASLGYTGMRVRLHHTCCTANPTPCGNSGLGQVEDYTIYIMPEPPCTGTPAPGNTLSTANPACPGANFTLSLQNAMPGTGVTYQWQSSLNGSAYTNISGATNPTLATSQTVSTYYRCIVTCSGNSGTSTPLQVTTVICYCAAGAISTLNEKISNTTFNTINNNSSSGAGYESFTNIVTAVEQTLLYTFTASLSPGYYDDEIIVWIDYNQDGDFTDAGEKVFDSPNGAGPHSSNITIPASATLGYTGMRVRLHDTDSGPNTTPCGNSQYGQVEDYTIYIMPEPPCTGTPAPGNTLSTANPACPGANFTLSLQNAMPGTGVTYQWQSSLNGSAYTNISGATNPTLATSQTVSTYYRCIVTCSGNSGTSTPLQVTTVICYCAAGAISTLNEKISNTNFNTINNSSSSGAGYESFTNIVTAVEQTLLYTFTASLSPGYYDDEIIVWIDYNQDGDFTDAGEKVFDSPNGAGPHSGNITIPASATLGHTGMRVRLHDTDSGPNTTPCGNSTYGQVEDYTLNITENCSAPSTSVATNITSTSAQANWTPTAGSFIVEWGTTGFTPGTGATAGSGSSQVATVTNAGLYAITGLTANTAYQYYVRRSCASSYTPNSSAVAFTTLPPPNDAACNALLVTLGAGCTLGNNTGATIQASEPSPACYGSVANNTVWYKFVAPASGSVRITTDNGSYTNTDTQIGLFAIGNCSNLSTSTLLDCNEDGGMACTSCSVVNYSGLTAGTTYYVQVDGKNSTIGSFCITIDEVLSVATNANACTDYTVSNVSGNNWISINADASQGSPIVAAINPNGLNLGTVTLSMRDITTVEQAPSGKWYLPRYYDWHCSGGPDCPVSGNFPAPVSVRLFLEQTERTAYNTAKGGTPATVNDFTAIIYDGNNEDCSMANNTLGTTTTVAATGMAVGSSLFYLQYNMAGFSETRVSSQTPSPGAALDFAYGNYVEASSISFGNAWTVEGWVNPSTTVGGWFTLFSQSYWNNNQGFAVVIENGFLRAESPQGLDISTSITANTWTHVALAYEHGVYSLYKNGTLAVSQPVAFTNAATPFLLGRRTDNNGSGITDPYSGKMDEVLVWTRALGQCEIVANMNCEVPATGTGLVTNYHFNQGMAAEANASSALTDASGNGNTGTLNGFAFAGATSNWAAPGGVATGASCSTYTAPEINSQGNGNTIIDGDNTPSIADHTDFNNATSRTFTIQNTGSATLTIANVSITGTGAPSFSVTQPAGTVPASGSTTFVVTYLPSAGTHTATLTVNNADCEEGAYDFAIQAEGLLLPVELVSFTGKTLDSYNQLAWTTASEEDVQWHVIERSANGTDKWQETGRLAGAGTTQEPQEYRMEDRQPLPRGYYRLRTVDFDGSEQLSHVIILERESDAFSLVNVFPVPTVGGVTLQVSIPEEAELTVTITDLFGKVLSIQKTTIHRGINNLSIDLGGVAPGVYYVQVSDGVGRETGKVVKQ